MPQVLNTAKADLKYVLVYLHSVDHEDTEDFCNSTLADSALAEYLRASDEFLVWGGDVRCAEACRGRLIADMLLYFHV